VLIVVVAVLARLALIILKGHQAYFADTFEYDAAGNHGEFDWNTRKCRRRCGQRVIGERDERRHNDRDPARLHRSPHGGDTITALATGPDWRILASEVRLRKFGTQEPPGWPEKARQARFLQYRGFSSDHIRSALGADLDLD